MIYHQLLSLQQDMQPGTAKPLPLLRQFTQPLADGIVISLLRLVAIDGRGQINQPAGFPFTQPKALSDVRGC